jgi:hypothetical protein
MIRFYIIIAAIAIFCGSIVGAFLEGRSYQKKEYELEQALKQQDSGEVTVETVTKYVDRIKYVDKVQIVKIPVYINEQDDSKCKINNGAIDVMNSSASSTPAPPVTEQTHEDSGKKLSELTEVVTENYTTYNKVKIQLESLQEWIREQQKVWNSK